MAASLQASAMLLSWANCTSIWRNLAMIYSGLNLFFGMGAPLFQVKSLNQLGPIPPSQVNDASA
jgi:hypothetical protein